MSIKKSFTLIEALVTVGIVVALSVAFAPGLIRQQQQAEVDQAVDLITNMVEDIRSLAISPTKTSNNGKVLQAWILVMNISNSDQTYCYHTDAHDPYIAPSCTSALGTVTDGLTIPKKSYVIMAAESTTMALTRYVVRYPVSLPHNVSVIYKYPCHGGVPADCDPAYNVETWSWKPHFRHIDGAIGFAGKYYNFPDYAGTTRMGYWWPQPSMWGAGVTDNESTWPKYSEMAVISGQLTSPESLSDTENCIGGYYNGQKCRIIRVDNINGAVDANFMY